MNTFKKGLFAGAAALAMSMSVQAAEINVGGVVWDPDSFFDFASNQNLVENQLDPGAGITELTGFGLVTGFNDALVADFCPGCELTFQFGGFELANVIPGVETNLAFTGGWIDFWVDHTPDYTGLSYDSAGDDSGANALFLRLEAHEVFSVVHGMLASITSDLSSYGAGSDAGDGSSLMDAVAGLAFGNFDTDGEADGADLVFTSSFQPYKNGPNPEGYELFGSADLSGDTIPEPSTIALLGLGLLGFAGARKRKA